MYARERLREVVSKQGLAEFASLSVPCESKATGYEPARAGLTEKTSRLLTGGPFFRSRELSDLLVNKGAIRWALIRVCESTPTYRIIRLLFRESGDDNTLHIGLGYSSIQLKRFLPQAIVSGRL